MSLNDTLFKDPPEWVKLVQVFKKLAAPQIIFHMVRTQLEVPRGEKPSRLRNFCLQLLADKGYNLEHKLPLLQEAFAQLRGKYEVTGETQSFWVKDTDKKSYFGMGLGSLKSSCYIRNYLTAPELAWKTDAWDTPVPGVLGTLLLPEEYLVKLISYPESTIVRLAQIRLKNEISLPDIPLDVPWSPVQDISNKPYSYYNLGSIYSEV